VGDGEGKVIAAVSLFLQIAAAGDSLPRITLAEALRRAPRLDPEYIAAQGAVDNAEWYRRAAWSAIATPSVRLVGDYARFSSPTFVLGADSLQVRSVSARAEAFYEVFTGGRKAADLSRAKAELERSRAAELQERFDAELRVESDYYQVLADQELTRVARERVRRAREQLVVARARVVSGAAVSTDSLQVLLELNRARVAELRQAAALRVSRLQLGRRVGMGGPADATPLADTLSGVLPITLPDAVLEASQRGPRTAEARAREDAAEAFVRAQRGAYLPTLTLGISSAAYDIAVFPNREYRTTGVLTATLPVWNGAQREVLMSQARVERAIARVTRLDAERAVARDVTEAYTGYETAQAAAQIAQEAILVARENYRVQETRYRAGATTILDLLEAQIGLTEAEAGFVQARYAARLALGRFEAQLGRRLFNDGTRQ
jgi:outer membrane protein